MAQKPIHIIGAGVAGLGIALELAQSGADVTVYDKSEPGRGASWAAAGMLAAILESEPGEEALLPLLLEAQKRWPAYAARLNTLSGSDVGYIESGTIFAARERDDIGIIRQRFAYFARRGIALEWLDRESLQKREPFISPRAHSALYSASDHQVDNRALIKALLKACKKAGVTIHANAAVDEILTKGNRVSGLRVNNEDIPAETVVLAAGAWSGIIKGISEKSLPPVYPLKGQMLALQMEKTSPLLRHVLWTPRVYLVPRADGRLVIGATMEDRGFEVTPRAGSVLHLLREAFEILPGIEELPLIESWTGLRPTSTDDAPIIGKSAVDGLIYATGQHRHGILLTPLLAEVVSSYIIKGHLNALAAPFTMARFGT